MPEGRPGRPGSTAILTRRAPTRSKARVIEREAQQSTAQHSMHMHMGQPQVVNGCYCSRGASSRRQGPSGAVRLGRCCLQQVRTALAVADHLA